MAASTSDQRRRDTQPVARPEDHLAYLIARVHHRLQNQMDQALRSSNVTRTQFYALAHIAQEPELSGAELARRLLTTPQAAATLVTRLVALGLVERDRPGRGRPGPVRLTTGGRATMNRATSVALAAEAAALSSIPADDQQRVGRILQSLLDDLDASTTSKDGTERGEGLSI